MILLTGIFWLTAAGGWLGFTYRSTQNPLLAGTAALLLDRVLPDVPVRQFVLTVPFELRLLLAQKAEVLAAVGRVLASEVERACQSTTAS